MKKLNYILITTCIFFSIKCFAQINQLSHEKYWFYRKRLVNEFLASGEEAAWLSKDNETGNPDILPNERERVAGCGLSIPARKIENAKALKFTEGTVELGNYICVLATELRLLYDYGQPYENTQRELYYAKTPIPLKGGYNCLTTLLKPLALLPRLRVAASAKQGKEASPSASLWRPKGWEVEVLKSHYNITHPKHHQL